MYEHHDVQTDMTALITLSRYFDHLLHEVNQSYKLIFQTRLTPIPTHADFFISWQNMFESECDLVKNLSAVGMALHNIRNVEAVSAM